MQREASRSTKEDHPWLANVVFGIDRGLRRRNGVFEFSSHPKCMLRLSLVVCDRRLDFGGGFVIESGDRLADIHLWNEKLPLLDQSSLAWSHEITERFLISLQELARFVEARKELEDLKAVRARMSLAAPSQKKQIMRLMEQFGFEYAGEIEKSAIADRVKLLGENMLISMMILARNEAALRADALVRGRTLFFLSRKNLKLRFGHQKIEMDSVDAVRP